MPEMRTFRDHLLPWAPKERKQLNQEKTLASLGTDGNERGWNGKMPSTLTFLCNFSSKISYHFMETSLQRLHLLLLKWMWKLHWFLWQGVSLFLYSGRRWGKRNAVLQYRAASASSGFLQLTGCSWGCVLPCIFIPAVSLCSAPVSSEMSLIRKVSEKAVYIVILFGFSCIKPPADQAPLDMSASEWIFIQCRKGRKLTRAENFSGFQKAVIFFYHCSHQPAIQPASRSHRLFVCLNRPWRC